MSNEFEISKETKKYLKQIKAATTKTEIKNIQRSANRDKALSNWQYVQIASMARLCGEIL